MMEHKVSEKKNLLHFLLLHPFLFVRFVIRSPSLLFMYLIHQKMRLNRLKVKEKNFQPAEENRKRFNFERFPIVDRIEASDIDDYEEIELASRTVSSRQQPDWSFIYEDIEDTFSLNRFGWLLTAIYTRPSMKLSCRALEWINNWIDYMGENFRHPAWESYSVSERLANWPFILRMLGQFQPLERYTEKKIVSAIITHIDFLLQNLELKYGLTNNHILNNARGLYIGGLAVDHRFAVETGKEIFFEWTPKLFHSDGMLKEGSSHYQFLLCQRFEQICLLSHLPGDDNFHTFMKKWTYAIRRARDLFNIHSGDGKWTMPLIGDISPDFEPKWFSPSSINGWEVIRNSYACKAIFTPCNNTNYGGLRKTHEGFFRYDRDDLTVFWHISDGPVALGSHGHFDVGSFVLFLRGTEIFTDSGRRSYHTEGSAGVSAEAHNCLLIDGLGPFCEDPRLNLVDAYPYQMSRTMVTTDKENHPVISLKVDGFRRLSDPVLWERSFSFKERSMTIRDDIEARGNHNIVTRFIIAKGLSAEKIVEGLCIKSKDWQVTLKVVNLHGEKSQPFFIEKAEISKKYGNSETTLAFLVTNSTQGNHTNIYEIKW